MLAACREADLVLFDLKVLDPAEHTRLTGRTNETILRNFEWLVRSGALVRVRVPVIPGENDSCRQSSRQSHEYVARIHGWYCGRS